MVLGQSPGATAAVGFASRLLLSFNTVSTIIILTAQTHWLPCLLPVCGPFLDLLASSLTRSGLDLPEVEECLLLLEGTPDLK